MRFLLTGCAGFIGSHVTDHLLKRGHHVVGIDDLSSGRREFVQHHESNQRFNMVFNDFASEEAVDAVKTWRPDVVVHLAALPRVSYSVEHPLKTHDVNVTRTMRLIDACRGNIGRFIFASSSSVYGGAKTLPTPETEKIDPKSPYALQKAQIEQVLWLYESLYRLESFSLRFFNVFGPRALASGAYATAVAAWLTAIKQDTPLRFDGDGTQSRDMCYVDNVVDAIYRASTHVGHAVGTQFNVACGDSITNGAILDILKERYGDVRVEHAPWRAGDVMHTMADISKIGHWFGYQPLVRVKEGIQLTMDWFDANWSWVSKLSQKGI